MSRMLVAVLVLALVALATVAFAAKAQPPPRATANSDFTIVSTIVVLSTPKAETNVAPDFTPIASRDGPANDMSGIHVATITTLPGTTDVVYSEPVTSGTEVGSVATPALPATKTQQAQTIPKTPVAITGNAMANVALLAALAA